MNNERAILEEHRTKNLYYIFKRHERRILLDDCKVNIYYISFPNDDILTDKYFFNYSFVSNIPEEEKIIDYFDDGKCIINIQEETIKELEKLFERDINFIENLKINHPEKVETIEQYDKRMKNKINSK